MNESHSEETIFAGALRLPPEQRAAFLDQAVGNDAALRQRIERLLKASEQAGGFLEESAAPVTNQTSLRSIPFTEKAGDKVGRYKLLQQIGEGGCGVVYMAEQEEPVLRRVALKLIKLGMDTKSVIARFEAERQALAMMDHPNIARVLDAGASETGRPYFVMELVRGVKITDYCDHNNLSTHERLDLFTKVCQAIQHAHQKGIIHRDIKPSNILVTLHDGVPVPKVIDFGIAKATQGRLTNKTLFTAFEQFIGTPAYMSPEQAEMSGLDIDTRSDIYSLGVLLYELLTGKTPFDASELLNAGLDEMRRTIREQEPQRPSTKLSTMVEGELTTTAKCRHTDAPKLISDVRGDLDWIVMKALEKDRARRYETANGLARDIERHLNHEPVAACPPSNLYRLQKLVRRNKLAFAAGAAVFASLLVGLSVSTWMFLKERAAVREQSRLRQQAQAEAARSEQVVQFLKEMLKGLGPSVAWGGDRTLLQEMLKQTAERIGQGLTNQPDVAISLRLSLAETYEELGLYEPEAEIAEQALSFAQSTFGKESLPVANALAQLGWAEWRLNKLDQAEKHMREGLAMRRKLLGNEHALVADSLGKLSFVLNNKKQPAESEAAAREALTLFKKVHGDEHPHVARSLATLATALRMAGRFDEAEPYAREALTLHRKLLGNGHYDTTTALNKLALVLMGQRKFAEAEDLMRESLATQKKLLGEKHPELALSLDVLGRILSARKQDEAEAVHREAVAQQRKLHGDEHPTVAASLNKLAIVLDDQAKLTEAEAVFREALALTRKLHGDEHLDVAVSLNNLAIVLRRQSKLAEAEAMFREALALNRKLHADEHANVAQSLYDLAIVLFYQGKLAEAETRSREALALRRKLHGDEHPDVAHSLNLLAVVLGRQNKLAEAETIHREALTMRKKLLGNEHPDVAQSLDILARVLNAQNKLAEAETMLREALTLRKKLLGDEHKDTVATIRGLAELRAQQGKFTEAAAGFAQLIEQKPGNDAKADNHQDWHKLAALLVASGQLDVYREHCRQSAERFGHSADPLIAERIAKDCLMLPASGADLGAVAKMADTASAAAATNHWAARWFQLVKGLAEYRQGRFTSAVEWMNKTLSGTGEPGEREVEAYMVLAMARWQLRQADLAWSALARGDEIERTNLPKLEDGNLGGGWLDWIIGHALLREARAMLEADSENGARRFSEERVKLRKEKVASLRAAAEKGDDGALNELAWLLATCIDSAIRDGRSALGFAERAVAKTERKNPGILDTLAAACAEAGEFARAVSVQTEAIALLHDEKEKKDYESRLKLYQSNTPYRVP